MRNHYAKTIHWALCLGALALVSIASAQETPTVNAAVDKNEVVVGEPFVFQIQVNNVSEAETPDLSALEGDFTVEFGGGKRNSSESISFINGRTTRVVSLQYLINYRLTPKRAGRVEIPAITLTVEGHTLTTQPVAVQVNPPAPVKDFKLSTSLSKSECYVGEPISMTTTYYIDFGGEVRNITFSLPVLSSTDFHAEPFAMPQQRGRDYYQIPVNNEEVVAEKGKARLDGQSFVTLTFQHVLVPKVAGELVIPEATAAAEAAVGRRSLSPFASRDNLRTITVPSEALTLSVRPVPEEGKPANFSGLIGAFKLSAEATPTEVNVGDPITLTIAVEGSFYLRHFELPPLQQQVALAGNFRIPEEMAPGRAEENRKIFTQTIRAESASVTEIPPIELAYFDTGTGSYATAATQPIPITVRETEVVTASDAEGYRQSVETVEHVAVNEGIAHNFTEPDALEPQYFGPDVWMRSGASWMLLLLPPLAWSALAGTMLFRRLGGIQPKGRARRMARAQLGSALAELDDTGAAHGKALQSLRTYLAAKIDANASALTYADVERPLRAQGAGDASLEMLKRIFEECEASHYAGAGGMPVAEIAVHMLECADALEKEIG
jgi:hypothetical protein